jgi:lantibiotic transport system ATP-binding protein
MTAVLPAQARPQALESEPVIAVCHLEKRYGSLHALRGLDLSVGRSQIYGFLGPNGAGKTTTIRMLLGLIRPSGGQVRLFGQALERHRSNLLARVGSLVETPSAYGHLTGRENLEVIRRMLDAPRENVLHLLELVGLTDAADRPARGYSLGMKGRLSLAAALLNDPELLILDEPTNGLDPAGIREVRDLIRALPARGITVLVSSHLLTEIEQLATHVGIIAEGRMRFEGTLEALRRNARPRIVIETNPLDQALTIVRSSHPEAILRDGRLEVPAAPNEAAALNRQLLEAGIEVSRLEPVSDSLEELFMNLTARENH